MPVQYVRQIHPSRSSMYATRRKEVRPSCIAMSGLKCGKAFFYNQTSTFCSFTKSCVCRANTEHAVSEKGQTNEEATKVGQKKKNESDPKLQTNLDDSENAEPPNPRRLQRKPKVARNTAKREDGPASALFCYTDSMRSLWMTSAYPPSIF